MTIVINPQMGGNGKAQFTSSIGGTPTTRVTGNTWDSKDAIGVFMKQGNGLSNVLASNKNIQQKVMVISPEKDQKLSIILIQDR